MGGVKNYYTFELLLETIKEGEEFRHYDENELVIKFRVVDVKEEVIANAVGPQKDIRLLPTVTVHEMKHKVAEVSISRCTCVRVWHYERLRKQTLCITDGCSCSACTYPLVECGVLNPSLLSFRLVGSQSRISKLCGRNFMVRWSLSRIPR